MEHKLQKIFDFQRFQPNAALQKMIDEAEGSYRSELSLDELEWVAAAGNKDFNPTDKKTKTDR